MKYKITLLLLIQVYFINAQISINNQTVTFINVDFDNEKPDEEIKEISSKKYLSLDFKPTKINENDKTHFLRFNIFKNQMEFMRGNQKFYLEKKIADKIFFTTLNTIYKVYSLNDELLFFKLNLDDKNSLLTKQTIKFIEAKEAKTGYDKRTPPNFKRKKDKLYIAFNNTELKLIPSKKKKFYPLFGNKASEVKKYVKDNKLKLKDVKDLKKIIYYFNSL